MTRISDIAFVASALLCFALVPSPASASAFLESRGPVAQRNDLLDELERVLGSGRRSATEARVAQFEDAMRPIFQSMPRNDEGRLPASGVRYLLHRIFVERHGWFVEGLASSGESWNSSSPAVFFAEHAGEEAEDVFGRRLDANGLSLHETAVFAATLESLVHEETLERLHSTYRVLDLEMHEESSSESEVQTVVDTYMLMFVLGLNHSSVSPELVMRAQGKMEKIYPNWHQVQKWVREVRKEVVSTSPELRTAFSTTAQVLEEVADRYGRWQDSECMALKDDMMRIEKAGTGRVPLKDFYSAALNGSYQFVEKREYLRQLGALDETSPSQPSVIIPNYINSASNCLASSKFYSVCCISECESLLQPLERHIGSPDALPEQIVELVEKLPSSSVDAPRKLSPALLERLDEIASRHGGRVPIHGRLFALWMHNAYPRECPFPHLSGTTAQLTAKQLHFVGSTQGHSHGTEGLLAEVEVCSKAEESAAALGDDDPVELPWSAEEELFVQLKGHHQSGGSVRSLLRTLMMLVAASSMGVVTLKAAFAGAGVAAGHDKKEKHMV